MISEAITITTAITTATDAPIINDCRGSLDPSVLLLASNDEESHVVCGETAVDWSRVVCMLAIDVTADVESWIDFIFAWEEVDIAGFKWSRVVAIDVESCIWRVAVDDWPWDFFEFVSNVVTALFRNDKSCCCELDVGATSNVFVRGDEETLVERSFAWEVVMKVVVCVLVTLLLDKDVSISELVTAAVVIVTVLAVLVYSTAGDIASVERLECWLVVTKDTTLLSGPEKLEKN